MTGKIQSNGADAAVTLDISLLGRAYKVACKESERTDLLDAVALVDRRMREIRDSGKIAGSERIAVMAALNIAHDLQRARKEMRGPKTDAQSSNARVSARPIDDSGTRGKIAAMQSTIDQALAEKEKRT
jgi:cell division protein ZapA